MHSFSSLIAPNSSSENLTREIDLIILEESLILDLFLINSKPWDDSVDSRSKFYSNNGDGTFDDVSEKVGLDIDSYAMGATVADYDSDGDLDVYVTALGPNILLRNDDGHFVDVSDQANVEGESWIDSKGNESPEWSTGAGWADVLSLIHI